VSERTDYHLLRKKLLLPGDRIDRIENLVVSGMPDINFCAQGIECWIEQKTAIEPKRFDTSLLTYKINQDQKNWFLRQMRSRGRAFFLITTDKRWVLMSGSFADFINDMSVIEILHNCAWSTSKPIQSEQWTYLREALIS